MNYQEARQYLNNVSASGFILGLDSIRALMAELGNPQDELKIIHIAGTNGKGSILTFTQSILKAAGYTVGAYSSPSVFGYLERFQINGAWMDEEELGPITAEVKAAADRMVAAGLNHPTVFELETAIAFCYFRKRGCDYVVLETGMGGDLDSTNVITKPLVCAFASISMDHIGVLGNTLKEIAECKSGIIKPGAAVVSASQKLDAMMTLRKRAIELGCSFKAIGMTGLEQLAYDGQYFCYRDDYYTIGLHGRHQLDNAAVAIEIIDALKEKGAVVSDDAVKQGLAEARWPGRLEIIERGGRYFILDGAHNEDAARKLTDALEDYFALEEITAVMGVFRDKEYEKIADLLSPYVMKVYCVELPDKRRTLPADELAKVWNELEVDAEVAASVTEAIDKASGTTLITGSLSLLKEAREHILNI